MQIRLHRERSLKGTSAFHFLETKTSQRRYETEHRARRRRVWMHFRSGCALCSFFLTRYWPFDFERRVWGLHLHFCASIFNQPIGQHAQATSNFAWFLKMRRIYILVESKTTAFAARRLWFTPAAAYHAILDFLCGVARYVAESNAHFKMKC